MKKLTILLVVALLASVGVAQDNVKQGGNTIELGRAYIPKAFVHAGKDYKQGIYRIVLFEKDGTPWFRVLSKKKELLYEEVAVVVPYNPRNKRFRYRVGKEMLRGYEFYRYTVYKPEKRIILYFMVKQKEKKEKKPAKRN